jgi:anti-sigma B factor antagonist
VPDQASKLHVGYRRIEDVTVLDLTGAMTLDDGDLVFRRYIHSLLEQGRSNILVNLAGLTTLDSAGVGMLVAKLKTVREHHGDMKLLHVTARSSRVLGMMKILTVFESFEDEALALKSFAFKIWEP